VSNITYLVPVSDIKCRGSGVKNNISSTGVRYQVRRSGVKYIHIKCRCQISRVRDQVLNITCQVSM